MTGYVRALQALIHLFESVGDERWARRIEEDLDRWRRHGRTDRHRARLSGRGPLSDLIICETNGHRVGDVQEVWANELLRRLTLISGRLADDPGTEVSADGDDGPRPPVLEGWRCLVCGHGEVDLPGIDRMLAPALLSPLVREAVGSDSLVGLVDRVLAGEIPGLEAGRRRLRGALEEAGVRVVDRQGWMRPCPACGEEADTAVYRWRLDGSGADGRLRPASNNLSLRSPPDRSPPGGGPTGGMRGEP